MNYPQKAIIFLPFVSLLLLNFALTNCKNDKKSKETCNLETNENCGQQQVCETVGPIGAFCLEKCDPRIEKSCGSNEICYKYPDGNYACTPTCSNSDSCGENWICAKISQDASICKPECNPTNPECKDNEVCMPVENNKWICTTECNPVDEIEGIACFEELVCELRTDGKYGCYEPVVLKGMVFDSTNHNPVANAHVMAADKTGSTVTDVAITNQNGIYELQVPVKRNPDGTLNEGIFTLRVSAADYIPFPKGIRPAIPVDATTAAQEQSRWVLQNPSTDVALIPLPPESKGAGSISGKVEVTSQVAKRAGVLVVAETKTSESPYWFTDLAGNYTIFNVPAGSYEIHGYKAFVQLDPVNVELLAGENKTGVNLIENAKEYGTVTGNVNIVNAPGNSKTTVVLVPVSTFNQNFLRGEVPPGLRAPAPPAEPSITGSYQIDGVPDGTYKVLAAFENDKLVRDPDPSIAGTQIVEITVPDNQSYSINIDQSFKITEALLIISPGAEKPEPVSGNPEFVWKDDSSEEWYSIIVYDAYGNEIWKDENIPSVSGEPDVRVNYSGPQLITGMYYQFRATSWRHSGPISTTEDLLGVFYIQ